MDDGVITAAQPVPYPCPCCGYRTLPEQGRFDICPVCFWEDDVIQSDDPFYAGGANVPSLVEAQANFRQFGACEPGALVYVRPPLPAEGPPTPLPPPTEPTRSQQRTPLVWVGPYGAGSIGTVRPSMLDRLTAIATAVQVATLLSQRDWAAVQALLTPAAREQWPPAALAAAWDQMILPDWGPVLVDPPEAILALDVDAPDDGPPFQHEVSVPLGGTVHPWSEAVALTLVADGETLRVQELAFGPP